ncbi:MAG: hypothetical protein GF393_13040, partial [Armatimonadia bacterium]|nr:hypothetical protein [Armatimonadia bacterium]
MPPRKQEPKKPKHHAVIEFGKSVQGRPILGYVFGKGPHTLALIGGLYGDQPGGETI